jgi:outer membrane immunogenic protein
MAFLARAGAIVMKTSALKILAAAFAGITATSAFAADMAVKARPMPVAVYDWTGFYIGGNAGYSWGRSRTDVSYFNNTNGALLATGAGSFDMDGWVAGGQAGYNWQRDRWVLGLEGDIQATGQKGSALFTCAGPICSAANTAIAPLTLAPVNVAFENKLDWFATFRGRAGVTFTPTVLGYVTGGLAVGGVKGNGLITGFAANGVAIASTFSNDDTRVGWTVGAGVEASLGGNWTGKIEYLYLDLGNSHATAILLGNAPPIRAELSSQVTDHIARVGINYRFGGPAVVAKY